LSPDVLPFQTWTSFPKPTAKSPVSENATVFAALGEKKVFTL